MLEVQIEFANKEFGTLPYESIPAIFLFLKENGIRFNWDEENRKIYLLPGLKGKAIEIMEEILEPPHIFEKATKDVIDGVQIFLRSCGATVYRDVESQAIGKTDLRIVIEMKEDPVINRPKLEVFHDLKMLNHNCSSLLKEECKTAEIEFSSHVNPTETDPYMKFIMKVPRLNHSFSSKKVTEKFQMIISMGILSRLQANYPLFLLSCLPFHKFSLFNTQKSSIEKRDDDNKLEKNESVIPQTTVLQNPTTAKGYLSSLNKKSNKKNFDTEVFFDYQVIFDGSRTEKILLYGNLFIKNTGESVLRNPIICFRTTPKGNINFSGQLVPPNVAETLGVLNSEKGWKFMYEDWFQQVEEKGEIWVCPIKPLEILPGQIESFQNFRINLVKEENQQNLKVEGFVFFQEQGLEYKANNSISLSF
ncbi:hypothetical protein [Neobacillus mesonae]|uniref:hypothetical protein n=1 Tax=Neobacillus mesonae TaxID=1193713 RepID=UPI00203B2305|nr:hypothetical protein [Neobacillus mesonae]MCM3568571.1 hypothetical protein [Neobacillus mesonae]